MMSASRRRHSTRANKCANWNRSSLGPACAGRWKRCCIPIPAKAVLYAPYGDSVYVVESKKDDATGQSQLVVRQQIVRLGVEKGDFVAVVSGLKEGETIVTSGVFKLRPGSTVVVNNSAAPDSGWPFPSN